MPARHVRGCCWWAAARALQPLKLAKRLADAHPDTTVLRRIFVGGMIASPNNSVAVALNGVEPEAERAISQIPDKLKEGAWLQPDSDGEVLIGVTLAKRLQVSVGDKVVVTSSRKGELQGFPFRVAGTFEVGSAAMDAFFVLATLSAVQNLIDEFISQRDEFEQDKTKLFAMVDRVAVPLFDFDRISKLVLAKYWKKATPEQRETFSEEFRKLLIGTYATALFQYTGNESVNFTGSKITERKGRQFAVVNSQVSLGTTRRSPP